MTTAARKSAVKKSAAKKAAVKKAAVKKAAAKKPAADGKVCSAAELQKLIKGLAEAIIQEFPDPSNLLVLGIRTRGVTIADRLCAALEKAYKKPVASGVLDITLYRDDLSTLGPQPMVRDSDIPHDITGSNIVLVDDVLFTGRTARAAMDEIVDFGRPLRIRLAVLIDRGLREYPIQADYIGKKVETVHGQVVHVRLKEIDPRDEVVLETLAG